MKMNREETKIVNLLKRDFSIPSESFRKNLQKKFIDTAIGKPEKKYFTDIDFRFFWGSLTLVLVSGFLIYSFYMQKAKVFFNPTRIDYTRNINMLSLNYMLNKVLQNNDLTNTLDSKEFIREDTGNIYKGDDNYNYVHVKYTDVVHPLYYSCPALMPDKEFAGGSFENYEYRDDSNVISKSISKDGQGRLMDFMYTDGRSEFVYRGGSFAIVYDDIETYIDVANREMVSPGISDEPAYNDLEGSISNSLNMESYDTFGDDVEYRGVKTIDGTNYYEISYSYTISCSEQNYNHKKVMYL